LEDNTGVDGGELPLAYEYTTYEHCQLFGLALPAAKPFNLVKPVLSAPIQIPID